MSHDKDSLQNTIKVSLLLCIVCSVVVSSAAVLLKSKQVANDEIYRARNVLTAAGLYDPAKHDNAYVARTFADITVKIVDLETGEYLSEEDMVGLGFTVDSFDKRQAAKDPVLSVALPASEDIAVIRRMAKYGRVYVFEQDGRVDRVVLPVHGAGLWGPLYAYLAVEGDGNTILGLSFYEHGETPGLGGEIDNPKWKAQWPGKEIYGDDGSVRITVTKAGQADLSDPFEVDGLSGSTLTSKGVDHLVRFWVGNIAFGPYLERLRAGEV
jgi:Na+-transporting NADH:ubiquinone oxidoreductase subunit C